MTPDEMQGTVEQLLGQFATGAINLDTLRSLIAERIEQSRAEAIGATEPFDPEALGTALGAAAGFERIARSLEELERFDEEHIREVATAAVLVAREQEF